MKTFEKELPANYRPAFTVDAGNKKTGTLLNLAGLGITVVLVILFGALCHPGELLKNLDLFGYSVRLLVFVLVLFAYIVLHELVHGAAYKLLTRQKLSFGIKLTVAYCGVPDIYVYRRTALISLLAPFTVFIVVFGLAALLLHDLDRLFAAVALAIHIGSCAGDLYDTALYLFRFRDPATLMRDTGPLQTFYLPERQQEDAR